MNNATPSRSAWPLLFLTTLLACSGERSRDDDSMMDAAAGPICGDGVLTPGERCDPGIPAGAPGACPADCDDGDPCTTDQAAGSADTCDRRCEHPPITAFIGGDRCCPPGADATSDPDCGRVCGNGILEPGELCDPGIAAGGAGACVTAADCNDNLACTRDELTIPGGDACQATCIHPEITTAGPMDGCCPSGATPGSDPDCAGCGDGAVGPNETCDTAIASGPGECPTAADCDDADPCTSDALVGGGSCNAACTHTRNTTLVSGDGCCATPGTFPSLDSDCPRLGLGYLCNVPFDCQSNRCEFFETAGERICTTSCNPQGAEHEGGCPPGAGASWTRVCLSAAEVSNGGAQNVCAYFTPGPVGFAELPANGGLSWGFTDPAQLHVYMLPSYADGIARTWRIDMTPQQAPALDLAGRQLDPALLPIGAICNGTGPNGAESCTVTITAGEASERFWFVVWPQAGLGAYAITLTLL